MSIRKQKSRRGDIGDISRATAGSSRPPLWHGVMAGARPPDTFALIIGCVVLTFGVLIPRASALALTDVPLSGVALRMRASQTNPERRSAAFRAVHPVPVPTPVPDPTRGASLFVFASNAAGQCRAEISLDPAKWEPIRGDGATHGYQYRDETQGIRRIRVRRLRDFGRIIVRMKGAAWPCGLEADRQETPIAVVLRMDDTRFCASFGGSVRRNRVGGFRAVGAPSAHAECPDTDLTVANLNLLHGLGCPDDFCRLEDRVDLFYQWVAASGCPDLVTVQEVIDVPAVSTLPFLQAQNETVCPFAYEILYPRSNAIDGELLLTRYRVLDSAVRTLYGGFRHVLFARLDHPLGPVDVFTTHLASGSDGGTAPCGDTCPPECLGTGAVTVRDCQGVQMALFVQEQHDVDAPGVITGDFNDEPGSFVYGQFVGRGWTDTYLEAGNPECEPSTGVGCTSGRDSSTVAQIESTAANVDERIDYAFLIAPGPGSSCTAALDPASDDDGDGTATRIFADRPNPFASCGAVPEAVCWPSDHEGTEMDLNCD